MKNFFKQIFKSNEWEHISQDSLEMVSDGSISDFWRIVVGFIGPFLVGWLAAAVSKDELGIPNIVFGIITGLIFAFLATIKCYYEFWKVEKNKKCCK